MQVIIDAKGVMNKKVVRRLQRLNRRKILHRQDTIDGAIEERVGPNRGNEAYFDTKQDS